MKRRVVNSGKCSGSGDPHLSTLDGVAYDFQKAGVFRLVQSRNFQVQVYQEKCTPVLSQGERAPSCYQGVAVAFGPSVARFLIGKDGKIAVAKSAAAPLQWLSVEKIGGQADAYRVFMAADESTYVDITLATWINNYPYLNVALQMSPYFKDPSVAGLMGNWNGNPSDDLKDEAQLAKLHGFSLTDNLFTCMGDACAPFVGDDSQQDALALALPDTVPLLHQGYTALPSASLSVASLPLVLNRPNARRMQGQLLRRMQSEQPRTATPAATTPDVSARAAQLCSDVITGVPTCSKYVSNTNFFIHTVCYGDAVMLGDLSVVDNTKLSYLRECRRELDARLVANTSSAAETSVLKSDRLALSFGDLSRCANDCSGRGTCLSAGCQCDAGVTGFICDVAL